MSIHPPSPPPPAVQCANRRLMRARAVQNSPRRSERAAPFDTAPFGTCLRSAPRRCPHVDSRHPICTTDLWSVEGFLPRRPFCYLEVLPGLLRFAAVGVSRCGYRRVSGRESSEVGRGPNLWRGPPESPMDPPLDYPSKSATRNPISPSVPSVPSTIPTQALTWPPNCGSFLICRKARIPVSSAKGPVTPQRNDNKPK